MTLLVLLRLGVLLQRFRVLSLSPLRCCATARCPYLVAAVNTGAAQRLNTQAIADYNVVTCQSKAWMDTPGGFTMYTDTVLVTWWEKHKTSERWSGEGSIPAKRLLVVCDNASVHKGEELTEKLEQYCIILRFLPPNMTAWLQVVCGLIKTLQRARRVLHLARNLKAWKEKQVQIIGACHTLLIKNKTQQP